jgi:hypothetical protein
MLSQPCHKLQRPGTCRGGRGNAANSAPAHRRREPASPGFPMVRHRLVAVASFCVGDGAGPPPPPWTPARPPFARRSAPADPAEISPFRTKRGRGPAVVAPQWVARLTLLPLGPARGEASEYSAPQPPGAESLSRAICPSGGGAKQRLGLTRQAGPRAPADTLLGARAVSTRGLPGKGCGCRGQGPFDRSAPPLGSTRGSLGCARAYDLYGQN